MVLRVSKRKPPPVVPAPSSARQGDLFRARRGKRLFLWQGACGQVTGGGGGGRAGPAPAALSFTGSEVGPDGKNRQAPKKGQSFGVASSVWKGVPKGLNTTGTQYLEDSALQGPNAAGTAPKPRAPNRVSALCPPCLRLRVIDLAQGRLGDRGSSNGMLVPLGSRGWGPRFPQVKSKCQSPHKEVRKGRSAPPGSCSLAWVLTLKSLESRCLQNRKGSPLC